MKKLIFLITIIISITTISHAASTKKQVKQVQRKTAFLAEQSNKTWQALSDLNTRVSRLEKRKFMENRVPRYKNYYNMGNIMDRNDIDDTEEDDEIILINPSMDEM